MEADDRISLLKQSPLLCDPDFHTFLSERAQFSASHGDNSAVQFRNMVGFLRSASLAPSTHLVTAFRQGLKEAGFVEDQDVAV